jgi:2-keto-4-pentenoate hydratase
MPVNTSRLAAELRDAEHSARPIECFTDRFADFTWHDARNIARARDGLRVEAGEVQIGFKLGWTSAAMREALGIQQPNWGTLWQSQVVTGRLDLVDLIHPKVEPELVFRSSRDLHGDLTGADIATSGGTWALGVEVVDPRWPSFDFDFLDNTADNSSGARVAIGTSAPVAQPADVAVEFTDGSISHSGDGSNAMGDPNDAVAWLVRSLAEERAHLPAGHIVFTGGLTAPYDITPDRTYTLTSATLPPVSLVT